MADGTYDVKAKTFRDSKGNKAVLSPYFSDLTVLHANGERACILSIDNMHTASIGWVKEQWLAASLLEQREAERFEKQRHDALLAVRGQSEVILLSGGSREDFQALDRAHARLREVPLPATQFPVTLPTENLMELCPAGRSVTSSPARGYDRER